MVRRALPQLTQQWRVYALVRRHDAWLASHGVIQLLGDLDRAPTLQRLTGIAQAVIHSAPPGDTGNIDRRTRHLIAALEKRRGRMPRARSSLLQHLVYISTTGVYGDCAGACIDETRTPAPATPRAKRRCDAERRLRAFGKRSGCAVSILRAPGIYATDRLPLDRLRKRLPLLEANDDVYTNHIHADDLAAACIAALRTGRPNRLYNVCDDTELRMGEWYDKLADAFALPRAPRMSRAEIEAALPAMQLSFMRESRRIGNARVKQELGLQLRYPRVDDGIAAKLEEGLSCSG